MIIEYNFMIHTLCVNVITINRKKTLKSYGFLRFFS